MSRILAATMGNLSGSVTECMQGRFPHSPRLRVSDSNHRNYKGIIIHKIETAMSSNTITDADGDLCS